MTGNDVLKKQLEETRLEHTIDYVKQNAGGLKKLGVPELHHLNQMLNHTKDDTWRTQSADVIIPGGRRRQFSMVTNSVAAARDVISCAHDLVGQGKIVEAATYLYSHLVMNHFFKEANRRTAVVATFWLLLESGKDLDAHDLLKKGLGDLSDAKSLDDLRTLISKAVR